jgi:hypothetical protein
MSIQDKLFLVPVGMMKEKIPFETYSLESNQSTKALGYSSQMKKFHAFCLSMILLFSALTIVAYFYPDLLTTRSEYRYFDLALFSSLPIFITVFYLYIYFKFVRGGRNKN